MRFSKQIGTIVGIIVIIGSIVAFNTWWELYRNSKEHGELLGRVIQGMRAAGMAPVDWDLFRRTRGSFEGEPQFAPELLALDGRDIVLTGFATPAGRQGVLEQHNQHGDHHHASMFHALLPRLVSGHVHTQKFSGVTELLLMPLHLDCYYRHRPLLRETVFVRMAEGVQIEFTDGSPLILTGKLQLNRHTGPKFFYVLRDAEETAPGQ